MAVTTGDLRPSSGLGTWRTPLVIIICGCAIALLSFGPRSSLGFFIQPMSREFTWGRDVFGLALALQNLLWGLGQPIAGAIADRFGVLRVMIVGALRPRFSSSFAPPKKPEGAGKTGCALHPRSRVQLHTQECAHEHTGSAETLRPSLRSGFTAYFVLSPENGSFASVAAQGINPAQLDASTAAPGPHDFAVRLNHSRRSWLPRPLHLTARS